MNKTMKRLIAVLLAMLLTLPSAFAFAEETPDAADTASLGMSITEAVSVDEEALSKVMAMLGAPEDDGGMTHLIVAVVNALKEKVVIADNGVELGVNLNDTDVFALAGEVNDEGITIGSSLFPNYLVSISPEVVMEMMQSMMSQMFGEGSGMEDGETGLPFGIDPESMEALSEYVNEFIEACQGAVVPGEPEETTFSYKGVDFNVRLPIEMDEDVIAEAEVELVGKILSDENVLTMLEMASMYSGQSLDVDSILEMNSQFMSEEYLPTVDVSFYTNIDEDGNQSDDFCVVSESTYPWAEEPSYRYTMLSQGTSGEMNLEIPEIESNIELSYAAEDSGMHFRVDYQMAELYYGVDIDLTMGEVIVANADIYFMDAEKPLATDTITIAMDGERALPLDGAGKKVITLEDLMSEDGADAVNGLMGDIMMNGLGNLVASASQALPEAGELINLIMGNAQTTAAPEVEQETAVEEEQETDEGKKVLQLGTSSYTVEIPESYVEGELSEEDIQDSMVAYMYSEGKSLDFDIYQFGKDDVPEELADYAKEEAELYETSHVETDYQVNGIPVAWYRAKETYEGQEYDTVTCIMDDGDTFVEIVFWLPDDQAASDAEEIFGSLSLMAE